jgi:hypothetical protein
VQLLQACISYRRASLTGVYLLGVHLAGMRLIGVRLRAFQIWVLELAARGIHYGFHTQIAMEKAYDRPASDRQE